jgi:DNA (cytosine-5)-methyltransferase 1
VLRLGAPEDIPDTSDPDAVRRWVKGQPRPTAIDLFCGAGGLSLGLHDAGFSVLLGADNDNAAVETHVANLGGIGYTESLADPTEFLARLEAWGLEDVDLLAAGVPCQPFSSPGKSKIRSLVKTSARPAVDPRAELWRSFVKIVEGLRPRAVLVENVPGLAEWDEGAVLVGLCEGLRDLGYTTDARILEAYRYRVPQHRTRLFIVGLREGRRFQWPEPHRWRNPTVRQAIGDLPAVVGGQRQQRLKYKHQDTPSRLQLRLRRDLYESERGWIDDHITREVRADDAEAFALLGEGDRYDSLPDHLRRYRSDIFRDKYNRLQWDGLSRTITAHLAHDGYWYIHPEQGRTLSVREAARLQTFPDWFRFAGTPTQRFRQIGNAVPPLLAEAVGTELVRALRTRPARPSPGGDRSFREDLLRWHPGRQRAFAWRSSTDPWHVLMAEMCLHRTRAEQVASVFEALVRMAPAPADMVLRESEVRQTLASLGLSWRVDRMIETAGVLVKEHHGKVPTNRQELLALPGVGDYVANAVLCFGFSRPAVLMDTNTERIVSRVKGRERTRRWQLRLDLYDLAGATGGDAMFNYALLDLGAAICTARKPKCETCPVAKHCMTARGGAAA